MNPLKIWPTLYRCFPETLEQIWKPWNLNDVRSSCLRQRDKFLRIKHVKKKFVPKEWDERQVWNTTLLRKVPNFCSHASLCFISELLQESCHCYSFAKPSTNVWCCLTILLLPHSERYKTRLLFSSRSTLRALSSFHRCCSSAWVVIMLQVWRILFAATMAHSVPLVKDALSRVGMHVDGMTTSSNPDHGEIFQKQTCKPQNSEGSKQTEGPADAVTRVPKLVNNIPIKSTTDRECRYFRLRPTYVTCGGPETYRPSQDLKLDSLIVYNCVAGMKRILCLIFFFLSRN